MSVQIRVETNPNKSFVVGRNGTHKLAAIKMWRGCGSRAAERKLFIDGVGVSGRVLNAGFVIDRKSALELLRRIRIWDF